MQLVFNVASVDTNISCSDVTLQLPSSSFIMSLSDSSLLANITNMKEEPLDADARDDDVIDMEIDASTATSSGAAATPDAGASTSTMEFCPGGGEKSTSAAAATSDSQKGGNSAVSDATRDWQGILLRQAR